MDRTLETFLTYTLLALFVVIVAYRFWRWGESDGDPRNEDGFPSLGRIMNKALRIGRKDEEMWAADAGDSPPSEGKRRVKASSLDVETDAVFSAVSGQDAYWGGTGRELEAAEPAYEVPQVSWLRHANRERLLRARKRRELGRKG
jgi:hypothetical protein